MFAACQHRPEALLDLRVSGSPVGRGVRGCRGWRLEGVLEFGEGGGGVFEQAGVLLPVRHLAGGELADDQGAVDFDEQDGADLDDGALGVAQGGDELGDGVAGDAVDAGLEPVQELGSSWPMAGGMIRLTSPTDRLKPVTPARHPQSRRPAGGIRT
jgi:hypothetical protein